MPAGNASTLAPFCSDEDRDTISYTKLSSPAHGTLSDTGGTLVYTPADGYTGPDQFNYKATDGHGGESAPATHHVQVVTPSAPTCAPSSPVMMRTNSSRTFMFNCGDPFDDALSYVIDSQPARGTLSGSGPAAPSAPARSRATRRSRGTPTAPPRATARRRRRSSRSTPSQHRADLPALDLERQAGRAADGHPVLR